MVQLSAYGSALILAQMSYNDPFKEKFVNPHIYKKEGSRTYLLPNPNYVPVDKETARIKRWERENREREYTINYLREHYPNKNYAERYEKENNWNKPLMYPTEESKQCPHLTEDGRHCSLKRTETGCYTCCFVCYTPTMCEWTNCPILPEDRKPKSKGEANG